MSDETELLAELVDGCTYDGAQIGPHFEGVEVALTMVNLPVEALNYESWAKVKDTHKAQRANYLPNIQLSAREEGDEFWTHLGHFGAMGDQINYDWFDRVQVRELMTWLEGWSDEIGFCAPCPGFKCHRDAPPLP